MKKSFLGSLFGTLLGGLLLAAGLALSAALPLPGVTGPTLGDPVSNLYTLAKAYTQGSGLASSSALSVSQSSGQANCTQLAQGPGFALTNIGTSAGTGYVCLPTAYSGAWQVIYNSTGSTVDIYSSAVSFTPGTADTIDGTAGSTAYTGLTTKKVAICYAVANGSWACGSIS